jgi:hypothetical protein
VAYATILAVACIPDLQPMDPPPRCDGGQTISYDDASDSLKTPQLEDAITQYEALAGQWTVDVICPSDSAAARRLEFAVQTSPSSEIEFRPLCVGGQTAVTSCTISFSGQGFPELSGQSADFDVRFLPSPGAKFCVGRIRPELDNLCDLQNLDPSYDPSLSLLALGLAVDSTNAVSGTLIYGFQPYQNPGGGMTQEGYNCGWTNARRVAP